MNNIYIKLYAVTIIVIIGVIILLRITESRYEIVTYATYDCSGIFRLNKFTGEVYRIVGTNVTAKLYMQKVNENK